MRHGPCLARRVYTDDQVHAAMRVYATGTSLKAAAATVGMSEFGLRNRLGELGYKTRRQTPPNTRGENHYAWRGDAAQDATKRCRARRYHELDGPCEICGEREATDRHHMDGDPGNNESWNIARLCRRCHMMVDGRLERNLAGGRVPKPPKRCAECERLYKPLRRGLCSRCYDKRRRPRCGHKDAA